MTTITEGFEEAVATRMAEAQESAPERMRAFLAGVKAERENVAQERIAVDAVHDEEEKRIRADLAETERRQAEARASADARLDAIMAEVRADKAAIEAALKDARMRADAALAANRARRTERLSAIADYDRRLAASEGEG